jgi:hypothetical protein
MHIQHSKPLTLAYGLLDRRYRLRLGLLRIGMHGTAELVRLQVVDHLSLYYVYDRSPGPRPFGRCVGAGQLLSGSHSKTAESHPGGLPSAKYSVSRWTALPHC